MFYSSLKSKRHKNERHKDDRYKKKIHDLLVDYDTAILIRQLYQSLIFIYFFLNCQMQTRMLLKKDWRPNLMARPVK